MLLTRDGKIAEELTLRAISKPVADKTATLSFSFVAPVRVQPDGNGSQFSLVV
jgi:hypothetical protein